MTIVKTTKYGIEVFNVVSNNLVIKTFMSFAMAKTYILTEGKNHGLRCNTQLWHQ